jgi:hypothetical protein
MVHQFRQNLIDKPLMSSFSEFFLTEENSAFIESKNIQTNLPAFTKQEQKVNCKGD